MSFTLPQLNTCYLTNNKCYQKPQKLIPQGIVIHSSLVKNSMLKRYIQPKENDYDENEEFYDRFGYDYDQCDWNHIPTASCPHYIIGGLDYQNQLDVIQTLPNGFQGYMCGQGARGSLDQDYLQIMLCLGQNSYYKNQFYDILIDLLSNLCYEYNINPLKHYHRVPTIITHDEAGKYGFATEYNELDSWLRNNNYTMPKIRKEINYKLKMAF